MVARAGAHDNCWAPTDVERICLLDKREHIRLGWPTRWIKVPTGIAECDEALDSGPWGRLIGAAFDIMLRARYSITMGWERWAG